MKNLPIIIAVAFLGGLSSFSFYHFLGTKNYLFLIFSVLILLGLGSLIFLKKKD